VSLFNIDQIPEKDTTALQCKICKGKMEEQPKTFVSKFIGYLIQKCNHIKIYRCLECNKELHIRESKA